MQQVQVVSDAEQQGLSALCDVGTSGRFSGELALDRREDALDLRALSVPLAREATPHLPEMPKLQLVPAPLAPPPTNCAT